MPPEQKYEWNGMNEGKHDLERARLQQMLERSCWIIHNEKNKVVVGLWRTSQNYEVKFCHSRKTIDWIDMYKETTKYFTWRIKKNLGPL